MLNLAIIIEVVGIVAVFIFIDMLIRAKDSFERKIMVIACICTLVHNLGYLSELVSVTKESAVTSIKIEYLGAVWAAFCLNIFVHRFCGRPLKGLIFQLFTAINVFFTVAIFTNEMHGYLYTSVEYVDEGPFPHVALEYGPLFYIYCAILVFICYMSLSAIIKFYKSAKKTERNSKKLNVLRFVAIAPAMPFVSMSLYAFKIFSVFDITPIVTLCTTLMIIVVMFKQDMFELVDRAKNDLIENMGDAFIVLDEYLNLCSFNDAAVELFPSLKKQSIGAKISLCKDVPLDIFINPEEAEMDKIFGERFIQCHVDKIYDSDNELMGYIALFIDVSNIHESVEQILEMKKNADAANQAKSDFLANMSHEIRTPMNAIIGLSELIIEESVGRKVYDYACSIKGSSQSLLSIINDILDISKIESGKIELTTVDYYLEPMLNEVTSMIAMTASGKGLVLKKRIDDNLPCRLHGDNIRVRQILINLLTNAVKYTKVGYVELDVEYEEIDEDNIKLIMSVIDTGIGLRPMDIDKIFQNFTQVDTRKNREIQGTGLGLAISRNLANLMGGDITVESEYGKGSKFTVSVIQRVVDYTSIFDRPIESEEMVKAKPKMFVSPKAKILIVDDNKINLKVANGILKKYQFEIDEATNGFDAIEMANSKDYDLIFMDHMMPEMDGVETTKRIRAAGNKTTIVALTANAFNDAKEMLLSNGFQDFVSKPIDQDQLFQVLDKWIPIYKKQYVEGGRPGEKAPEGNSGDALAMFEAENINFMEGVQKTPGGMHGYIELLSLFYQDGRSKVELIKQLVDEKDFVNYTIHVHGLKSASYAIAADQLAEMAKVHENAGRDGNNEYIIKNYQSLLSLYKVVLAEIKSILELNGMGGEKERENAKAITEQETELILKDILQSIENFKSKEAKEKLNTLMNCAVPDELFGKLQTVSDLLRAYEDEKAEDMMREIIENL